LTEPGLATIVHGIVISRSIFVRIRNFLTYRIAATLQLLLFFFIAVFWFKPVDYMPTGWETMPGFPDSQEWPQFFHMPVLMLMLITLLNDGTLIAIGYDHVIPLQTPEKWNRQALFATSTVLATVALISSLLLLGMMLSSWEANSLFQTSGLGGLSYGQITTAVYLKVSVSDFLTLFSCRTGNDFFFSRAPAPILLAAGGVALTASTVLACAWPSSYPDGIYALGLGRRRPEAFAFYIWVYCIIWWWIQDACKVAFGHVMVRYNWFGINDTGKVVLPESTLQYIRDNKERHMATTSGPKSH
jgi:H+-transporting ATPase